MRRVWRVLEREAHAAVCCERTVTPPFGLAGGLRGRTGAAGTDPAGRQCAQADQQGRLHRTGRFAGGGGGARLRRLRSAVGPRPRASFRRPAGRIRYRRGGAARLRRRANMSEGRTICQAHNRLSPRRARIGWRWRPASRTGGARAARAVTNPSATARTRAAAFLRSSSRRKRPARCRSAAARTAATSRAATGRTGACNVQRSWSGLARPRRSAEDPS